ncbi:glutathione S-transferase [Flagelloscypha sp. PMI_526]|nr:glutathione S-transferase [Flagelloscypha sp. PMI_526]
MSSNLTLYTGPTSNGRPIAIFLEELGLSYDVVKMSISDADIGKVHNQVKSPWYLEINPNGRIPAITHDGSNVFETSAILLYLAAQFDKDNKFGFDPVQDAKGYSEVMQWIMFAHGGVGPMQGQASHFYMFAKERIPYAITRYLNETRRLYSVLDTRLSKHEYLAADKYTVADIKTVTWVLSSKGLDINLEEEFPSIKAWVDRITAREAFQKGMQVP